jgi:hypothetical protein
MANLHMSFRKIQIDKANTHIVTYIAAATFVTIFSIFTCRSLLAQRAYQSRVIDAKEKAANQLEANVAATKDLVNAYSAFVGGPTNVLGGNPAGSGSKDGDNARIILDALPSKYDFPALATSLDKLLSAQSYKVNSITGSDDELNQQNNSTTTTAPVEIPVQISVSGSYSSIQDFINTIERSIRPIQIQSLDLSGGSGVVQANVKALTFYQPAKTLDVNKTVEVK